MKQNNAHILYLLVIMFPNTQKASVPPLAASSNQGILMQAQTTNTSTLNAVKHLQETVVAYPIRGVLSNGTIQQGIQNRTIKAATPTKTWPILAHGAFSVLRPEQNAFTTYPNGSSLFVGYPDLSVKFDTMISMFKTNTRFIPFFRKIHINALNELYNYLMGIYVNFNLQHTGIVQANDGTIHVSIPEFMQFEQQFDANKKTLIINHLINIIESQFNSAIRSYVPNLPQSFASSLGKVLVQNDYSIDLTEFLERQTEPLLIANKKAYLQGLATYLDFFQSYTKYVSKPHPKHPDNFTAFVDIAEKISKFLYADAVSTTDKEQLAVQKMNPPLFYFSFDDMRALKMIPYLAQNISKNSKAVMWPEQIVQAANQGILLTLPGQAAHPIAYFRTKTGTVVTNTELNPDIKLYVCMRNGVNLFEEELIAQPTWLNSWQGVARILRACFGDFSALIGMNILDPFMESLVELAVAVQQGQDPNTIDTKSPECKALLNAWKGQQKPSTTNLAGLPNIENLFDNTSSTPQLPGLVNNLPVIAKNISPALIQGIP